MMQLQRCNVCGKYLLKSIVSGVVIITHLPHDVDTESCWLIICFTYTQDLRRLGCKLQTVWIESVESSVLDYPANEREVGTLRNSSSGNTFEGIKCSGTVLKQLMCWASTCHVSDLLRKPFCSFELTKCHVTRVRDFRKPSAEQQTTSDWSRSIYT